MLTLCGTIKWRCGTKKKNTSSSAREEEEDSASAASAAAPARHACRMFSLRCVSLSMYIIVIGNAHHHHHQFYYVFSLIFFRYFLIVVDSLFTAEHSKAFFCSFIIFALKKIGKTQANQKKKKLKKKKRNWMRCANVCMYVCERVIVCVWVWKSAQILQADGNHILNLSFVTFLMHFLICAFVFSKPTIYYVNCTLDIIFVLHILCNTKGISLPFLA